MDLWHLGGSQCPRGKCTWEDRAGGPPAPPPPQGDNWSTEVLSSIYSLTQSSHFCQKTKFSCLQVLGLTQVKGDLCFIMWFFSPVLLNFLVTIRLLFGNNGTMILSKTFSKLNDNEVIFLYWVCGSTLFLKTDFQESWGLSYKCKQTILFFLFLLFESECFAVIFCCWSGVRSHSKKKKRSSITAGICNMRFEK